MSSSCTKPPKSGLPRSRPEAALVAWLIFAGCGPPTILPLPPPSREIVTVDGTVLGADNASPETQLNQNLKITVRPGDGNPIVVELAPGWYLAEHGLRFSRDDRVTVEGTENEKQVLVAKRVQKGQTRVRLRTDLGEPVWESPDAGTK